MTQGKGKGCVEGCSRGLMYIMLLVFPCIGGQTGQNITEGMERLMNSQTGLCPQEWAQHQGAQWETSWKARWGETASGEGPRGGGEASCPLLSHFLP